MAAKTAIEKGNLNGIRDVSTLYDQYFSSIRADLEELDDENVLKAAGIICFYRTVDKSNEQLMETIQNVFQIDQNNFWSVAQRLHEYELVDIHENEVVKIGDQVLATYLFYLCVFKNEVLKFPTILDNFFPSQISRIRDALYPCLNVFDFEQLTAQMRDSVFNTWEEYKRDGNDEHLRLLIETFWFILKTDALIYIRDSIELLNPDTITLESIDWQASEGNYQSGSVLELLSLFKQADDDTFRIAVDLIFRYLERRPKALPEGLKLFSKEFGFTRHSHMYEYASQHVVIDALIARVGEGRNAFFSKLFIELCKYYQS